MSKPHTQGGQRGQGAGRKKNRPGGLGGKLGQGPRAPGSVTPPSPFPTAPPPPSTPPQVGGMPNIPPPPPNFLPMTPGYQAAQTGANDQLMQAQTGYMTGTQMVQPSLNFQQQRLNTDRGYATSQLDESLAERGVLDSGIRPYLQTEKVAIPYGRAAQDLGMNAAQQYSDLANQWGGAQLGYNQTMMNALIPRVEDVLQSMPYALPQFGYTAPNMPVFQPSYPPQNVVPTNTPGGKKNKNKKTNKNNKGNRNQGGR